MTGMSLLRATLLTETDASMSDRLAQLHLLRPRKVFSLACMLISLTIFLNLPIYYKRILKNSMQHERFYENCFNSILREV